MATPKFDECSIELSKRLLDPATTAAADGADITADERTNLINRALLKLFNDIWVSVGGNIDKFVQICPELLKTTAALTFAVEETTDTVGMPAGVTYAKINAYEIASPYLDLKEIYAARQADRVKISVYPTDKYTLLITEDGYYLHTTEKMGMVKSGNKLYLFPKTYAAGANIVNVKVQYVGLPINPTTGVLLTQGGNYDSPFGYEWQDKIVSIAQEFYNKESAEV